MAGRSGADVDLTNEETLAPIEEEERNPPTRKRRRSEGDQLREALGLGASEADEGAASRRQSGRLVQVAHSGAHGGGERAEAGAERPT